LCALLAMFGAQSHAEGKRILFLTKSAGFQHSVIVPKDDKHSHAGEVLQQLADKLGGTLLETKDASLVNKAELANYDLVIFYTTMDLTQPGFDQTKPMGKDGVKELQEWIKEGGAFMGFHCASDTFHGDDTTPVTPYIHMLGAEFKGHGAQFKGIVKVTDPDHPTMANIPNDWEIADEWYLFKNMNTDDIHVLAMLDPARQREHQEMYNVPNYPIIWCREYGKGRIYYNAMGHREDVWTDETFQKAVVDAINWSTGEGEADAAPNCVVEVSKD